MASLLFKTFVRHTGKRMPAKDKHLHSNITELKKEMKHFFEKDDRKIPIRMPTHADFLIVGGGIMGMSAAYFLAKAKQHVVVVEKDPHYSKASTVLSVGGMRTQFSLPENIEMSLYGMEFLRNVRQELKVDGLDDVDVQFHQQGYLFLATEKGAETMMRNQKIQSEYGAYVELLSPSKLKEKFPWLNTQGIALGSYGIENEGWFDPHSLLSALRAKAAALGADIIQGELIGFQNKQTKAITSGGQIYSSSILEYGDVKGIDDNIYPIKFAGVINAAGHEAAKVAAMANIGTGEDLMSTPLPVEPRKRDVFGFHCQNGPGIECPLVVDPSGLWFRREGLGGLYLCGMSPPLEEEPDTSNLDVDHQLFEEKLWPILAHRVPSFEKIKMKTAWAGYYDYNYFDENLIIGNHIIHRNFIFANGSSGHGLQHGPAVGRALKEFLVDTEYTTINLSRMSFDRVIDNQPLFEENIV